MSKKAKLYARVSTDDQDLEPQVDQLIAWAEAEGYDYDVVSESVSAMKERPAFNDLMEDIKNGEDVPDVVAVRHLDRVGRSVRDILMKIDQLKEYDVGFVTVDQPIDTRQGNGPMQDAIVQIMGTMAEFERKMMLKRQKKGLEKAKDEDRMGRPPKIDGEALEDLKKWMRKGYTGGTIQKLLREDHDLDVASSTVYNTMKRVKENEEDKE